MPMEAPGLEAASEAIQAQFPWLALFDNTDTEITGGAPAYARMDISGAMSSNDAGVITITGPITFDIPSGATVAKFGLLTASSGGSRAGLEPLSATEGPYAAQGQYNFSSGSITVAAA